MDDANIITSTEIDGRKRKLEKRICSFCGNDFRAPEYRDTRFCSKSCATENRKREGNVDVTCWRCKKDFRKKKSSVYKATHGLHFCSRTCKDIAQRLESECREIWPSHFGSGRASYRERCVAKLSNGCVDCGEIRHWLLQVHHIDGNRNHNKQLNLEVVCNNGHQKDI